MSHKREKSGQILVLFAMGLVVFVGFAALVVDVGLNYAYERRFQAVADAASLAGAQELQPTTRSAPVTSTMQASARARALQFPDRHQLAFPKPGQATTWTAPCPVATTASLSSRRRQRA